MIKKIDYVFFLVLLVLSVFVYSYWSSITFFAEGNQGTIQFIGLCLVIPLSILAAVYANRINNQIESKKRQTVFRELLLRELWFNLNFVPQIRDSYEENLEDEEGIHLPHYPPRIEIIDKFLEFKTFDSLSKNEQITILEIYHQLKNLRYEFFEWKNKFSEMSPQNNKIIYRSFSETMLSYVEPAMRNMISIWLDLLEDYGNESAIPQIQEINEIMQNKINEGKWLRPAFRASDYEEIENDIEKIPKFDVILCWENDWSEASVEILEMQDTLALSDNWN